MGPVSINTGSDPTRHESIIVAIGLTPSSSAFSLVMRRTAPAPSEICEDVPAVWTPSGIFVRSPANASIVVSLRPSSRETVCVESAGCPSSPISGASIGRIWEPNRSSSQACIALSCESFPNASSSSLLMPHCLAIRSAPSNCDVSSYFSQYPLLTGLPTSASPRGTVAPIGTPLINSTPQPTATSTTPPATRAYARFVAC